MSKQEVAKVSNKELIFEPENLTKETIKNYLCKDATDQELMLGLQIAKSCGLNPLKREIYFIKYGNNPMMTVTGYEVYLKRAEASGQYDGMELTSEGSVAGKDLKATIKLYRKDWSHPLVHEVYYSEYVQNKADGTPNKFWKEKPVTMIKKVAVSQGFRMAFPEQLQGLPYTADEAVDQERIVDVAPEPETKPSLVKTPPQQEAERLHPIEAVAEAEVVKSKVQTQAQTAPQPVKQPDQAPAQTADVKTVEGIIVDNKIKSFVTNGKAGNKYGCKIGSEWYGTFSSTDYDLIKECQKNQRLVKIEYTEAPVTKDGKTTVYYNIVTLKETTMDGKTMDEVKENF